MGIHYLNHTIDINPFKDLFASIDEKVWYNKISIQRKENRGEGYGFQVYTLPLMFDVETVTGTDPSRKADRTEYYDLFYVEEFFDELYSILKNEIGDGYPTTINFHLMKPKSKIYPHTDGISIPATINHRVHVPITTREDIIFKSGNVSLHMKEGHVYLLDNNKIHSTE